MEEIDYDMPDAVDPALNRLSYRIIACMMAVHRELGAGYLESMYENALAIEFRRQGVRFERQFAFSVRYEGEYIGDGRCDFLVEDLVVVELKAVERLMETHAAQVRTYLKALNLRLGLLANFNTPILKDGLRRVLNQPRP